MYVTDLLLLVMYVVRSQFTLHSVPVFSSSAFSPLRFFLRFTVPLF